MSELQTRLGARVRELRSVREWTQERLGEESKLSYKFIGEIERGVGNPTVDSIEQIAKAFGIDVVELFRPQAPETVYTPVSAGDFAIVREARESLTSLQDFIKRLDASVRPRGQRTPSQKKRSRPR